MGWKDAVDDFLNSLAPVAEKINGILSKKYRGYHDNDKRHKEKALAKRRKKNKNLKTHRK